MVELELQDYEKNVKIFNKTKLFLLKNLTNVSSIEHVGSTAILNMLGKNIIDILIGVDTNFDFESTFKELEKLNFYPSKNFESNIYHFFASSQEETKSGDIHIHLARTNTERYNEFLILRDYLIQNPDEAQKYSNFKQKLIADGITERKIYREEKAKYVSSLIERAKLNMLTKK